VLEFLTQPRPGADITRRSRRIILHPAVPLVSIDPQGGDDRPARETRALASCRLSPAHANRRSADKSLYLIVFAYDPQPRTNARLV